MKMARYLLIEEKLALLRRIEAGERLAAVADETGVLRKSLYEWRAAHRVMGAAGLNRRRGPKPGGRAAVDPPSADAGPPAARPPDELTKAKARIGELERLAITGDYGDGARNAGTRPAGPIAIKAFNARSRPRAAGLRRRRR